MLKKIENVIDVHQHICPKFYIETVKEASDLADSGGVRWPKWSPEKAIKVMEKRGIDKGLMCYTNPGIYFKDDEWSRAFARKCNEYLAEVVQQYPTRFGGWACLPLPDVEGALIELEYAMDTLKLDGIGLMSNVNGIYPGDENYRELFEEMNKRNSVVFIHPNDPQSKLTVGLNNVFYNWFVETSKAALGIAKSGYVSDYPNVRYILAHAGGVYPAFSLMLQELKEPMMNAIDSSAF